MATLESDIAIVEKTLCDRAQFYANASNARTLMAFDREHGQFLLIDEGWQGYHRVYHVWAHIELREGKIWIHEDGMEEGIANLLVANGIPRDRIVLAFQAPALRMDTEFAPA